MSLRMLISVYFEMYV
jgi:hypothetical protein